MQERAKNENRLTALAQVPLFAGFSRESLALLAVGLSRRRVDAGEVVFSEGEPCTGLHIVESGLVRLYKLSKDGREQGLTTHGPGETLSELPVIDGGRYPFCAAAVSASSLLLIGRSVVQSACRREPICAQTVLGVVADRLRAAWGMIEQLSFDGVERRLAAYLLRLSSGNGASRANRWIELPSNHDIAAEIGTVRELVSRHLGRLHTRGIIDLAGRTFRAEDWDALAREATGARRNGARSAHQQRISSWG